MTSCCTAVTSQQYPPAHFFKITTIDGLTTETANHALRCTALSGFVMAPSIPVILDILRRGTHNLSAECQCLRTPEGSV